MKLYHVSTGDEFRETFWTCSSLELVKCWTFQMLTQQDITEAEYETLMRLGILRESGGQKN